MTYEEIIENVAREIYYSWENYPHASDRSWDKLNEKLPGAVEVFKKHAIRAVESVLNDIQKPTDKMVTEAIFKSGVYNTSIWSVMLNSSPLNPEADK